MKQTKRYTRHRHTQGGRESPTYSSWGNMKQRCLNDKRPEYPNYGGRGISVCDRWLTFDKFLLDMGERPAGHTLDRIDSSGNYEPSNCRWATYAEQRRNQRPPKLTAEIVESVRERLAAGEMQRLIAADYGIDQSMVSHIKNGKTWRR